ncbi:hypothetical protein [Dialister invisus]|uniref:hypothetical protein n=1 Tax=Dialister invisus TaxID=218538 RepID=UPI0026DB0EAE|nr:hypothetical protein [Dialister invisus]
MMPYHIPSFRAGARMLCGKMRNGSVTRSEESITLMTPYRLSSLQQQILRWCTG